jgi:peroxiredoxin
VKILTGQKAPDLVFHAPVRTQTGTSAQDILIETGNLDAAHTILLFYQGECPLCEDALIDLANKYKGLAEQNVRVITVSADKTEQGFEKKLAYHLWPDNYCDFSGMAGGILPVIAGGAPPHGGGAGFVNCPELPQGP